MSESASSSASEWDECRLDSTRVLSSGTISASNVGSDSELELSSVLVLVLVLVGEGKAGRVPNGSWWWRRWEEVSVFLFPNTAAVFTEKRWASWARRGGAGTRIAWRFGMEIMEKNKTETQTPHSCRQESYYISYWGAWGLGGRSTEGARGCNPRDLNVACLMSRVM